MPPLWHLAGQDDREARYYHAFWRNIAAGHAVPASTPSYARNEPRTRVLEALLNLRPSALSLRALDLGSGNGRNAIWLAQRGLRVTAVEFDPTAVRLARDNAAKAGVQVNFIQSSVFRIPWGLAQFDLLLDDGLLHHVRRRHWRQYRRLAADGVVAGGVLAINAFARDTNAGPPKDHEWQLCGGHYTTRVDDRELESLLAPSFERIGPSVLTTEVDARVLRAHFFRRL